MSSLKARCRCAMGLCITVVAVAAVPAAAAGRTAVVVSGNAPLHERQVASTAVSAAATDMPGYEISTTAFTARDVAALSKCLTNGKPWACMSTTLRGNDIQQLAMVSIDSQTANDGSPLIVITEQVVTPELFAPVGDRRYCDHCTDDVLAKLASDLTLDMLHEVATRSGRTAVAIRSTPPGARITFDHKLIGATDTSISTYPGTHSLSLELDGYQVASRSVLATEGKTSEVDVTLLPRVESGPDPVQGKGHGPPNDQGSATTHDPRPVTPHDRFSDLPRFVPWLCIGAGGAAIVTGTVLVLVNQTPSTDPGAEQSRYYYSTRGPGIVTGIAGVLTAGTGLYILHRQNIAASAITAVPIPGGASVHWTTSF